MNRVRLGVEGQQGEKEINLKALFAAFDIPWDDERSPQIFQRTLAQLEQAERVTPVPTATEVAALAAAAAAETSATTVTAHAATAVASVENHNGSKKRE